MTMRLDVVTNDAGELVRRERSRELGANVVVDLYRLVKLVQMHELANAAVQRQREQTYETIQEYCLRSGGGVNILFADKAIFVGGQLLKGSRAVYENAVELAEILQRLGGSEVTIARELTPDDVMQLTEALANALRGIAGSFRSPTPRFRLRPVSDAARLRGLELEQLAEEQRIVRTYASAIVILRRFFESLENSHYVLPRRIKRVAQTLVDLSAGATPAFLGVTEVRNANDDAAGRAVNTAILSVSTVRQLTEQRSVLVQVAMAAMLFDVARPRALALAGSEGSPAAELSEDQEDRLAAGTAAVLAALGRVNEPSVTRTVVAFEAHWLRRQQWLGAMYNGVRVPTLHARVVRIARRYNDILTPEPGTDPPSAHHAVAVLYEELEDPKDRTALRLLVAALRIMPVGTVVRLSTGEVGEVVKGGDPEYPIVRIAMDAHGALLASPKEVDLSREMRVRIDSVISTEGWRKGRENHGNEAAYDDDPDSDPGQSAPPPEMPHHQQHQHRAPSYRPPSVPAESERRYTTAPPVADQDAQSGHSYQSGVDPQSYPSSESFPSVGTSPSQVAEAFGNLLSESKLRKHSVSDELRTMMVPSDAALKFRARTREPSASGNLATTPLAHVLVYMLDHTLGGSILFTEPQGPEHMLFFEGGVPAQARLGMQTPRIGDILMRLGLIDQGTMERGAQEANRLGVLVGEYLVGERKLRRADLLRALEAQLTERVAALANLDPGTEYAFFPDVNLLAEQAAPHAESILTSALNVILAVVRAWEDRSRIAATLTRVAKHTLLLHTEADVEAFALTSDEESVLTEIQAGAPKLAALIDEGIADARTIETLVYAFSITRQFAFKGQKKGPMAPKGFRTTRTAPPLPPGPSSGGFPSVTQSVGALRVASDVRESGSSPASPRVFAPEVPSSSSSSHSGPPSSSSMPSSGPVSRRPMVPSVRPKIRLRSDGPTSMRAPFSAPSMPPSLPASRLAQAPRAADTQVDDTQPLDDDDEVAVERAIEAMTEQRLAEAALQRNDFETALHHADKAAHTDPSQVEYQLLRAYIQGLIDPMTLEDGIAVATSALDANGENESALLYRARMHKLAGMTKDALSDYRTLYGLSPGHPEAESEIRVLRQQR